MSQSFVRAAALVAVAGLGLASVAQAETIYGITVPGTGGSSLVSFDSANPAGINTVGSVSGLLAGHTIRAIDFRPSNGQLYALSSVGSTTAAQLYTLDLGTGAATPVGSGITLTGNLSSRISIDFNPVPDALRVITGSAQSYRVNANTGALIAQDTSIAGDPLISGIAYSNNVAGATQTTLYAYNFSADELATIGGVNGPPSPNGGTYNPVGPSGIVTGDAGNGFDISGVTGVAYFSGDDFNGSPGINAEFFTVNLATGALTQVGPDDVTPNLLDISAVVPEPTTLGLAGVAAMGLLRRRRS